MKYYWNELVVIIASLVMLGLACWNTWGEIIEQFGGM